MEPYCRHIDFDIQTKDEHIYKRRFEDRVFLLQPRLPRANCLIWSIIIRGVGFFLYPTPKLQGVIRIKEWDHQASRDSMSRLAWTHKGCLSSWRGTFHNRALQINCGHCPLNWWWVFWIYFHLTSKIITILYSNRDNESGVGECAGYLILDCGMHLISTFCNASVPWPSATSYYDALVVMLLRSYFDGGRRRSGGSPLSGIPSARASSSAAHSEMLSLHC